MKIRRLIPLLVFGAAAVALRLAARQRRLSYPPPESLIIELDTDLLPQQDGSSGRSLPLQGAVNLRDIGGYRTGSGQYVRWGQVYRSGMLAELTEQDQQQLSALGLRLVCDLRGDDEIAQSPDRLPPGVEYMHLPIHANRDTDAIRRMRVLLLDRKHLGDLITDVYKRSLDEHAAVFGGVLRRLADPNQLPALFHCTAGKDRTGLAAALLLLALGVPEETVIADYSLSNRYYAHFRGYMQPTARRLEIFGVTLDDMQPLLQADPRTLRAALDYLYERYGSVEDYLRQQAGLDDETLERLKANLLT